MAKEIYSILVKGYLDAERSSWFDGMTITHTTDGETILSGPIADQAALHGVFAKIRDLGLVLLEVRRSNASSDEKQANPGHESEHSRNP
jgi:hypothetical protein